MVVVLKMLMLPTSLASRDNTLPMVEMDSRQNAEEGKECQNKICCLKNRNVMISFYVIANYTESNTIPTRTAESFKVSALNCRNVFYIV